MPVARELSTCDRTRALPGTGTVHSQEIRTSLHLHLTTNVHKPGLHTQPSPAHSCHLHFRST